MFNAFEGIDNLMVLLFGLLCTFVLLFFIYVISNITPYNTIIKSCESIGYFYINENVSIECKVIKK